MHFQYKWGAGDARHHHNVSDKIVIQLVVQSEALTAFDVPAQRSV